MIIKGINHYERIEDKTEIILDVDFQNLENDAVFVEIWDDGRINMLIMEDGFPSEEWQLAEEEQREIKEYLKSILQ